MIDIIITTYNRPIPVSNLIKSLLPLPSITNVIIVDSSEVELNNLPQNDKLKYLRTEQKNQPYQRYLGYLSSSSDYIIFLDDDMEVVDFEFPELIIETFMKLKISAIAIYFKDKHNSTSLSKIPTSRFNRSKIKFLVNILSGHLPQSTGKLGPCGLRGKQPELGGYTEYLSGGAFAAKRSELYINFNFQLFDLFNEKMGMGEDIIIGYTLHKQNRVYFLNKLLFTHNDQNDSTYTANNYLYAKRVIFSRLYLTLERSRLNNTNPLIYYFHYHWYVIGRLLGLIANYLINPTQTRLEILKGTISGYLLSWKFSFKAKLTFI